MACCTKLLLFSRGDHRYDLRRIQNVWCQEHFSEGRMKLVAAWLAGVGALFLCHVPSARLKVKIAFTANPDAAPAFVAVEEVYFKRRILDVELVQIRLTSDIPGALLSDSVQVGGASATSLLQASEGGIDLVAVAGSSVTDSRTA